MAAAIRGCATLDQSSYTFSPLIAAARRQDVRTIVNEELGPTRSDLTAIRDELDDLSEKFENVSKLRKEIDHALERIAASVLRLSRIKVICY
jgi:hypothetical protein